MGNKFKDKDIKNCRKYLFCDMINLKILELNKIKIIEKFYIRYVTIKDFEYVKMNSVNPLDGYKIKIIEKFYTR